MRNILSLVRSLVNILDSPIRMVLLFMSRRRKEQFVMHEKEGLAERKVLSNLLFFTLLSLVMVKVGVLLYTLCRTSTLDFTTGTFNSVPRRRQ